LPCLQERTVIIASTRSLVATSCKRLKPQAGADAYRGGDHSHPGKAERAPDVALSAMPGDFAEKHPSQHPGRIASRLGRLDTAFAELA
jgi:hypothetical protein